MEFMGSLGQQNLTSLEGVKAIVDSFFQILQEASAQMRQLQVDHEKEICSHEQLKEQYQDQVKIMEASEKYFQAKIQNIENEIHEKEQMMTQDKISKDTQSDRLRDKE